MNHHTPHPGTTGHVALLGDSIFDNAAYTSGAPDVVTHLRRLLPPGWQATLCAVDGATTTDLDAQLARGGHLGLTKGAAAGTLGDVRRVPLLLLLCAAAPLWGTAERPLKATLTEARGGVQVKESDAAPWETADAGAVLSAGGSIKTGPNGKADLLFEERDSILFELVGELSVRDIRVLA